MMQIHPAPAPHEGSWAVLKKAALRCRACPLYKCGRQTVFGEGPRPADIMIIGEQPGAQEDRLGRPFVGPSGAVLDQALEEVGLSRDEVYVTNAVKHFKWTAAGKRRLHKTANVGEIRACHPWLEEEIARVRPRLLIVLGRTAGFSVLNRAVRLTAERGRVFHGEAGVENLILSWHPAAILRATEGRERAQRFKEFVSDFRKGLSSLQEASARSCRKVQ